MHRPGGKTGRRGFLAAAGGVALASTASAETNATASAVGSGFDGVSGSTRVVVRFRPAEISVTGDSRRERSAVIDTLRRHARTTREQFEKAVSEYDGITVERRFWLVNAVLVTVDTDVIEPEQLADIDGVVRIRRAGTDRGRLVSAAEQFESVSEQQDDPAGEFGYGLEMMNVPQVWDRYDVRGEGVRIAVVDSGVDPGHPDIDLAEWAEFDAEGERIDSDPRDPMGHGTGMSSLAVGGDASGTHIGVAPEAELLVAKASEEDFFASTMAGLEWAIENGADVVSLSVEFGLYEPGAIEPIENAAAAGIAVTTAAGDLDLLTPPGDVPSSVITGVVDPAGEPYNDGSGGEVRTDRYWRGVDVPDAWPDRFVAPDVVAAGVDVLQAVPEAEFGEPHVRQDGYSNGPPQIAGVIALLQSAADERLGVPEITELLRETARQPGEPFEEPTPNGRYGSGIVNAYHAVTAVLEPGGEIAGTVTDGSGEPIEGATVTFETGVSTTTDQDGQYSLSGSGDGGTVRATATGYESEQRTVAAGDGGDIVLDSEIRPQIERAERQPTYLESGGSVSMRFDVAHVDAAVVFVEETEHRISEEELTLSINEEPAIPEEPVDIPDETPSIWVEIDASETAVGRLRLHISVGEETEEGVETSDIFLDPIAVHPNPFRLEPGADLQRAVDIAAPDTRIELVEGEYGVEQTPFDRTFPVSRTGMFEPVFGPAMDDSVGLVVDKPLTITAAGDGVPRIVARGDTDGAIAVRLTANYATLEGVEIDGSGADTAINVLDGSGVDLDRLTVANASIGIRSQFNASLAVRGCEIDASETGVLMTDGTQNALVRDTTVTGATRGAFVDSEGTPLDVSVDLEDNRFEDVETEVESEGLVDVGGRDVGEPPGDSSLDLLLYAATAVSLGLLFVPYTLRRLR